MLICCTRDWLQAEHMRVMADRMLVMADHMLVMAEHMLVMAEHMLVMAEHMLGMAEHMVVMAHKQAAAAWRSHVVLRLQNDQLTTRFCLMLYFRTQLMIGRKIPHMSNQL